MTPGPRIRGLVGLIVLAAAWQFGVAGGSELVPHLQDVLGSAAQLLVDGRLLRDSAASVWRVLAGVGISVLLGTSLGLMSLYWKSLPDYLQGAVELVRPIPPIAWTPVAIIAFGIGDAPAVAIVALGSFFPIWLGILQGLGEVKRSHLLVAASLGGGRLLQLTDIIIPSALPYAFHGFRLGVGLGWFCVVAAEMMGASSGLGYGIQLFSLNLEMSRLYVYLLGVGILGLATNGVLQAIDRRVGGWRAHT